MLAKQSKVKAATKLKKTTTRRQFATTSVSTAPLSTGSKRPTTSLRRNTKKNNVNLNTQQQTRGMAFSFQQPTNFASVKPVQREAFPWEKHNDTSTASNLINATIYDDPSTSPATETTTTPTRPPLSSFGNTKFSFSSLQPQHQEQQHQGHPQQSHTEQHSDPQSQQHHRNAPQENQQRSVLVAESRLGGRLTGAMHKTLESAKRSDMTGVAITDLDSMFKNSPLSGVFSQQHAGPTFWAQTSETPVLYFIGTRKVTDGATMNAAPPTFAFLKRHVNHKMRTVKDEFTTYSYTDDEPFTSTVVASLEPDLTRGTVKELQSALPPGRVAKSVVRYRGVGWKWHASVQMSQITTDPNAIEPGTATEADVFTATRARFTLNGYLSEKLIRSGNTIVATVVDDMKLVKKEYYDQKFRETIDNLGKM